MKLLHSLSLMMFGDNPERSRAIGRAIRAIARLNAGQARSRQYHTMTAPDANGILHVYYYRMQDAPLGWRRLEDLDYWAGPNQTRLTLEEALVTYHGTYPDAATAPIPQ